MEKILSMKLPKYEYYGIVAGRKPILAIAVETTLSSVQRSAEITQANLNQQRVEGAKRVNYDKANDHQMDKNVGLGILFFTIPFLKIPFDPAKGLKD